MKGSRRSARFIALALALSCLGAALAEGDRPVPAAPGGEGTPFTVLCYHRFVARPETLKKAESQYQLSLSEFQWQMQYLKDNGITPVSLEELEAYWFDGKPLPPKPVLLTFDDGFKSIYEKAYPVVKEFGCPAVLFLYTDFVRGQKDSVKYAEIEEMRKNGWAVESHTKSHMNLGVEGEKRETADYRKLVAKELSDPLTFIREKFGARATALAYPYGIFTEEVLKQAKAMDYRLAFTVNPGANDRRVPRLKLRRNLVLFPVSHKAFSKIFEKNVLHLEKFIPGDGDFIVNNSPILTVEIEDEIVPRTLKFKLGAKFMKFTYDPKTRLLQHRIVGALKPGGHTVTLEAKDVEGNWRSYSWYFRVKHRNWEKPGETDEKK